MNLSHQKSISLCILGIYLFVYVLPHKTFGQTDISSVNDSVVSIPSPTESGRSGTSDTSLVMVPETSAETRPPFPTGSDTANVNHFTVDTSRSGNDKTLSDTLSPYYRNNFKGYQAAGRGAPTPGSAASRKERTLLVDTVPPPEKVSPPPLALPSAPDSSSLTTTVRIGTTGKIITAVTITLIVSGIIVVLFLKNKNAAESEQKNRIPAPPPPPDF